LIALISGCSTTKKLAEGEILYTGVEEIKITSPESVNVESVHKSTIESPLSKAPNNPLYSPYYRTIFPTGLWVYNWNIKRQKGLKWWLYKNLAKKPVLISDVKPDLRLQMVKANLQKLGIFNIDTHYEILPEKHNPKKAKILYEIEVKENPLRYSSVELWQFPPPMDSIVKRSMRTSLLKVDNEYDVNILEEERSRITAYLRNRGYYYFKEDYIEYLADTVQEEGRVHLRIALNANVPDAALHRYKVKNVYISLGLPSETNRDTLILDTLRIDYAMPAELEPEVVARAVKLRPGQLYRMRTHDISRTNFVRLGVFKSTHFSVKPTDTVTSRNLDFIISADYSLPIQTEMELDVSSKSNNLLGPALTFSVTNNNFRRRAQIFSLRLSGAYEWQVGGQKNADNNGIINSYELGLNLNLSIPRIMPAFLYNGGAMEEHTKFQVGADFMNRNGFFRMMSISGSSSYELNKDRRHFHTIEPLKLTYTHLLRTSSDFDSTLNANPAIELSFRNQFIPSMSYSYTFDRGVSYRRPNRLLFKTTIMQAGNLTSLLFLLNNKTGENKKVLGNYYSQFLKLNAELVKYQNLSNNSLLAMRLMGGVGYAYGNVKVMPYSEQFYSGGSNSLRAFQIRSLGPGSYHPTEKSIAAYLDQTGEIKLEANLEYRFTLSGSLKAAFFMDAGNVWLLRKDENRQGGEFQPVKLWDEIALGTGFGIRYDISYLTVRADLGIALHSPYNTGKSGYFNIKSYNFNDGTVLNIAIGYPF
jgi:outer membrane protein assembly factor BamA